MLDGSLEINNSYVDSMLTKSLESDKVKIAFNQ